MTTNFNPTCDMQAHLLFKWTDNALIAANTGRPFSQGGLEAVCASHLSDKNSEDRLIFYSEASAKEAINRIRERELRVYRGSQSRVVQDARLEFEMRRDYTNRLLLELMQNADDAAAIKPIGYKGLGFKAVLDICKSAYIYSGCLRLKFDHKETYKALQDSEIHDLSEIPVLRLPFWNEEQDDFGAVHQLRQQYDTVIVLPWKDGRAPDLFKQEWDQVRDDITVMLLLHSLEEVIWEDPTGDRIEWQCERNNFPELSLKKSGADWRYWKIYKNESVNQKSAVAVQIDTDGNPKPYRHDKTRVFFPTDEESPLPMILHGEFDLTQNRKRIRDGGNRSGVIESLAHCVRLVLNEICDDGNFLDLLQPRISPETMTGFEKELWNAVKAVVSGMELPICKVRLSDVRLCPVKSAEFSRHDQRIKNWKIFKEILAKHRQGGLAGLKVLCPGTDTEQREAIIRAFNPSAHLNLIELREIPFFPAMGYDQPISATDTNLFFPDKDILPSAAPQGVNIAFLQEEFAANIKKYDPVQKLLINLGLFKFTHSNIAAALARSNLDAIAKESVWRFLLLAVAPLLTDEDAVMDWKDKNRQELVSRIKIPCRDGSWQFAESVYAGQDWSGNDFLERAYHLNPQRFFLSAPPIDEKERQSVERLSRWLGVGWSPKVLPLQDKNQNPLNFADKPNSKEGVLWGRGGFPISQPPKRWGAHCSQMDKNSENCERLARLRQDWTIDGDEDVLYLAGAFENIISEWKAYKPYLEAVIYRSGNKRKDNDDQELNPPSYLAYLFQNMVWIPVENARIFAAAADVFKKEGEVAKTLNGWVFIPTTNIPRDIAKDIGIRRDWNEVQKTDWLRWLNESLTLMPGRREAHGQLIINLYHQALRYYGQRYYYEREQILWWRDIWTIEKKLDNTVVWHCTEKRNEVYYVDRPDLAPLRLETLKIFPVELSRLEKKAEQYFSIPLLSNHLRGEPIFMDGDIPGLTSEIHKRLQDREKCLAAYLKVKGKDPSQPQQKWKDLHVKVGRGLRVQFSIDGQAFPERPTATYFQPAADQSPAILWLDATENFSATTNQPKDIVWEEIGAALCYAADLDLEDGRIFDGLIGCGKDSLKRKLLKLGVTENDIATVIEPIKENGKEPKDPPAESQSPQTQKNEDSVEKSSEIKASSNEDALKENSSTGGHRMPGSAGGSGGHGSYGGGGESPQHKKLKESLAKCPDRLEHGLHSVKIEYEFISGDRADLVCTDSADVPVAIEVETFIAPGNEVGLWQAVKYKHLLAVERGMECPEVRAFLVAPKIPDDVKEKCKKLGVQPKEVEIGE